MSDQPVTQLRSPSNFLRRCIYLMADGVNCSDEHLGGPAFSQENLLSIRTSAGLAFFLGQSARDDKGGSHSLQDKLDSFTQAPVLPICHAGGLVVGNNALRHGVGGCYSSQCRPSLHTY